MKKILKRIDDFFFGNMQEHYARSLEKEVLNYESLLDVGCGAYSPIKRFSKKIKHVTGVDIFEPSIEKSRAAGIHNDYVKANVLELDKYFTPKSFDCVIASDLIEHLSKEDGNKLIEMMEKIASKKVVIYTPNGFFPQSEFDSNNYQVHISGWEIEEMEEKGYRIKGINGYKKLYGEFGKMRWKPQFFWGRIMLLTQSFLEKKPRYAFGIMCVKDMKT